MTIYQIHEYKYHYSGCIHSIIGTYSNKEKAQKVCNALTEKERQSREQANKCKKCPLVGDITRFRNDDQWLQELTEHLNYCEHSRECYVTLMFNQVLCNYHYTHFCESEYEIKEMDVE